MTDAPATSSDFDIMQRNIQKLFPGVTWHPSREAWEFAKTTHPDVDPGKVALDFIRKNRPKKGFVPSDEIWLRWVTQEDRNLTEMRLRIEAEQAAQTKHDDGKWWPGE